MHLLHSAIMNKDGIAECCNFDERGYMLTNAKTPDGYAVNDKGAWVENGVVQTQTTPQTETKSKTNAPEISVCLHIKEMDFLE